MAKPKSTAVPRPPRDGNKTDDREAVTPEKPPESAEDFAHVLRRLLARRNAGARKS